MVKCIFRWMVVFLILLPAGFAVAEDEEFMLTFRHPAVGSCYVRAVFSGEKVFLPLGEILSLLYIHYEKDKSGLALRGTYPDDTRWEVNPGELTARRGREAFLLATEEFRTGLMDIFFLPGVYERLFGLHFKIDLSGLHLTLQSDHVLPVEERKRRNDLRLRLKHDSAGSAAYPLLFPRHRKAAGAGFADYSLGVQLSSATNNLNYTFTGGLELLAGDIQGTLRGFHSSNRNIIDAGNLRWRWALPKNPILTSIRVGQINTTGLHNRQIIGCAVTNDPVMPRRVYGIHLIDGKTVPGSEVELLVNNRLTGFTHADELGYYSFKCPLNYGTVRTSLRIYTPTGLIITEEKHMQIPYTFLPKGKITYNLQGGFIPRESAPEATDRQVIHGDAACGLTGWLTAKIGADYFGPGTKPFYYCSVSSRFLEQYLLNFDLAPDHFFRFSSGVTYPSGRSLNFSFVEYDESQGYNANPAVHGFDASLFIPLKFSGLSSAIRFQGEHKRFKNEDGVSRFRIGLSSRPGRANIRLDYLEHLRFRDSRLYSYGDSRITVAAAWNLTRNPGFPKLIKGLFARLHTDYNVRGKQWYASGVQLSQSIGKKCHIQMNADYYFPFRHVYLQGIFTADLPLVRSVTRMIVSGNQHNMMQNFSGSIAMDAGRRYLTGKNRSQAGQCGASVRMFVDADNDGKYSAGERKIPATAIRINGGASMHLGRDSILRISRLHHYWRYETEIVQAALPDPTLAPAVHRFSFIADPNRYKPIDIPLYRTGVIEGILFLKKGNGQSAGLAGGRIFLRGVDHEFEEILHTYSDGGFYAMNLLPGKYSLETDPAQLGFLHAQSHPQKLEIEIKALADGDFIEGLEIILEVASDD